MIEGFCSKCHKVWTLETKQGLCPWCGKLANRQTNGAQALRSIKSRSKARKEQANHNGNGYDQLEGEWLRYYKIASQFNHKAKAEDRQDLTHDIILKLASIKAKDGDRPLDEPLMYRVASFAVADYWRAQRQLERISSLDSTLDEAEGLTLLDTLADDNAIDLEVWLDAKTWLRSCPKRLIKIAHKKVNSIALDKNEQKYLERYRQKELTKAQLVLC